MSTLRSFDSRKRSTKPRRESRSPETESTVESWEFLRLALASDSFWQQLQAHHEGLLLLLCLRPKLQALAKRYRDRPQEFVSAWDQLLNRYAKRLGRPEAVQQSLHELLRPKQRLSKHQIKAMKDGSKILSSIVSPDGGLRLPPQNTTSVFDMLRALASSPPGPKPRPRTVEIQRLYLKGLRPAEIARQVFPNYSGADSIGKQQMIDKVRTVIKSIQSTHAKSHTS